MRLAVALRPEAVELRVYLAELTQRSGDLAGAIRIMEKLIRDNPGRAADLRYRLGVIYGAAGREEQALKVMTDVLEGEGKDDPRILNYVGYTWADRGVRLAEAERMIRRAIALVPEDGAIVDSLGWVLYKRGLEMRKGGEEQSARSSIEAGLVELERASRLDPGDPTIMNHLGHVYRSLARLSQALGIYRQVLELDIDDAMAGEIRREIEALEAELKGNRSGASR
jgi:Flp pilus assembly protein TadD